MPGKKRYISTYIAKLCSGIAQSEALKFLNHGLPMSGKSHLSPDT